MAIAGLKSVFLVAILAAGTLAESIAFERPEIFVVHFGTGDASLGGDAVPILDNAAAAWQQSRSLSLVISGHTDRVGSVHVNRRLSKRRADSVRAYLRQRFVPDAFITIEAAGETDPAVPTANGVAEPRNRRVEIRFQSPSP